jgi:hypothetical protein
MRTYKCKQCGIDCVWRHQGNNKFCGQTCSAKFRSAEHKYKFFAGLLEKRIDRPTARKYLAEERGYKCQVCGVHDWQGKPITLHVDHINGDPSNDHPNNLRLICPNCHSETEFLGGANKGRGRGSLGIAKY